MCPLTLNLPQLRRNISPKHVFIYFVVLNLILYIERGIIPGSNREFVIFINSTIHPTHPDVYIGLLQSAFLAGLSLSSPLVGHIINKFNPKTIIFISLIIWQTSVLFTAISGWISSYYLLFISRVISGIGEAALISFVPTFIMKYGGSHQGRWLATYLFMLPLGAAIGFGYGALIANSPLGWPIAFILIDIVTTFLTLFFALVPDKIIQFEVKKTHDNITTLEREFQLNGTIRDQKLEKISETKDVPIEKSMTFLRELKVVLSSPYFWCMLGNAAAYSASIISLQTFISPFVLDLGFLKSETRASILLGGIISISGIIGTILGGYVADYAGKHNIDAIESEEVFRYKFSKSKNLNSFDVSYLLETFAHICNLSKIATILSMLGCFLMIMTSFMTSFPLFIIVPFLGLIFIFATVAFNNLLLMLSVPSTNRPFAISLSVLSQHLFGDVPAQIIVGYIKDILAPDCIIREGQAIITDKCLEQSSGVRLTIFIINSWFMWMVVTFMVSWVISAINYKKIINARNTSVYLSISAK